MLAKPDRVAGALSNKVINSVLVELVREALSIQDARQYLLPLSSCFHIECAALVLGQDDLKRIPVKFSVRWISAFLRCSIIQKRVSILKEYF